MTTTIVARIVDNLGHASTREISVHDEGRRVEVRRSMFAVPAAEYRSTQPSHIALDLAHDEVIGEVVSVERDDLGVWIVAVTDCDELRQLDRPVYCSPEVTHTAGTNIELQALALLYNPGSVNAQPVQLVPGDLPVAVVSTTGAIQDRITRALEYRRRHPHGARHEIIERRSSAHMLEQRATQGGRPLGQLEHGRGGRVLSVR
jgi:hypothetical protein